MDIEAFKNELEDLISLYSKCLVNTEGAMCTNYVFVAEFVDVNNQYWTLTAKDESSPIWRTTGLMNYVLEQEFTTLEEEDNG